MRLAGELDFATGDLLDGVLRSHADRRWICLDLAELSFLDCAGLHPIIAADQRLRHSSGHLVLTHVSPRERRLLRLTRLDQVLSIAEDTPDDEGGLADA